MVGRHHVYGTACDIAGIHTEKIASIMLADILSRLHMVRPTMISDCELISGMPILEIVNIGSEWQADMIVMGSRTRHDIKDCLTGSVSKGVVMQAPCSVVTIKAPSKYFGYPSKANLDLVSEQNVAQIYESEEVHLLTG